MNKVPEGTEGKEGLQTRLDGLTPADVPAVTDQDVTARRMQQKRPWLQRKPPFRQRKRRRGSR
ncbi:hypothetical protein [Escherichia coli]|uniref:hypothetical protein n=1 Tax=Escherichia coli TaxID=562 RepID=UPI001F0FC1A2|nr:hypothetical protein [Escherichia coli]UMS93883.1 hypothetical protein AOY65_04820 [Escherichia coli]